MTSKAKKILIIGAGIAGYELLLELRKVAKNYQLVGFVDDDPQKKGKKINNVTVLGGIDDVGSLVRRNKIEEILIAIPSARGEIIRRILQNCWGEQVLFRIIPRTLELVQGKVKLHQLREIQVQDLIGQAIIKSEQSLFAKEFRDKNILVTGAAGSIGSELCRQLVQFSPPLLIALDWWESGLFELDMELGELTTLKSSFKCVVGNIQDRKRLQDLVRKVQPDVIFHAAAFKHVPLMQDNPMEAIGNNVFGTENVAKIAYEEGVEKLIYISTDKAADPKNVMGATKLIGEHIMESLNNLGKTKYSTVRFGNVLESYGSVVPIFKRQIANGGPVTVTDRGMTRFMMTIPEAVQLILHASLLTKGGEIFVLDMGEQIKILDLARFLIQISGFIPEKDIAIKYIGIRPGEKMEEQLFNNDEYLERTEKDRIFKVRRHGNNINLLELADLKAALNNNDIKRALSILKRFAPNLEEPNKL